MNREYLLLRRVITKTNMINPHFTRSVKSGNVESLNIISDIRKFTNFLPDDSSVKERIFCIIHEIFQTPLCHHCQTPTKLQYHQDTKSFRFTKFCTQKHAALYRDEAKILEIRKKTNIDRFGVINPMSLPLIRSKQEKTLELKYKSGHPTREHWSKETIDIVNSKPALTHLHHDRKIPMIAIGYLLGISDGTVGRYLDNHGIKKLNFTRSLGEIQLCEFLDSINISYETNIRTIINKELDVYIPSHNIAIEYNGLYWHADFNKSINPHTHYNKTKDCANLNIRLITIFEDEWLLNKHLVQQKLKSILHVDDSNIIGARNAKCVKISNQLKKEFFDKYHIQGNGPGSINIGLEHNNELIACMSFIKQKNQHYLNRYATSCKVPGGFSKLLKHFQQHYEWELLISFADMRWSNGNLYDKTGWTLDSTLRQDYCYVDTRNNKRIHKFNYRRKHLPKKLKYFDPLLSERQNCDNNRIPRLWDCGKLRYVIHK